jgi:hypothetical protein
MCVCVKRAWLRLEKEKLGQMLKEDQCKINANINTWVRKHHKCTRPIDTIIQMRTIISRAVVAQALSFCHADNGHASMFVISLRLIK